MNWLDRLLGRTPPDVAAEHEKDREALRDLHAAYEKVQKRTTRLELELRRVNADLRKSMGR